MRLQTIALIILLTCSLVGYLILGDLMKPMNLLQNLTNQDIVLGGDFKLTDSHNQPFDSHQLTGKPSLVYFGFTYCPDVCVVSLQKINKLMQALDKYNIQINPVFISIDPQRDTPQALAAYFAHYDKRFIALTGSTQQIKTVAEQFKVLYSVNGDYSASDYMLDHSTFIYLLDKNQKYITYFSMSTTVEEIVEYIRVYTR